MIRTGTDATMITAYFIVSARLIISESAAEPSAIASDAFPAMFSVPSVLLYSTVYFPAGEFTSYREFPSGELYYDVFRGRCIQRLLRIYSGRIPDFKEAAVKLGGILIPGGEAAVELELFDNLYIRFLLWEGDEEFPASSQILFSSNFPAAFSAYDLTEIVEILLGVMKEKGVQK